MFQKNSYGEQLTIENYLPRFNTFQNLILMSTKWNLFKNVKIGNLIISYAKVLSQMTK